MLVDRNHSLNKVTISSNSNVEASVIIQDFKMISNLLLLCVLSFAHGQEYVPGTEGAVWSDEEVRIVRLKINELLSQDTTKQKEMFPNSEFSPTMRRQHPVTELVLFRLSFHDCLAYEDGSPGCDGCLNWKNMGNLPPSPFPRMADKGQYCEHQFPKMNKTDNNGMMRIAFYLEKIYTDKDWPNYENAKAPSLDVSLKDSGKSRADLWQFAANVALERTIERANHACRYDRWRRQQVPLLEGVNKGKSLAYGIWKCKIKLTAPVKFRFGRKDCIPETTEEFPTLPESHPYATYKPEGHENPHENADTLLEHLDANLGLGARDFIALSSIHGMVAPFQAGSIGTKYRWLGSGPYLSNMYYKFLANRPTYFWKNGFGMNPTNADGTNFHPFAVGDKDGNPVASWGFRVGCSDCWDTAQTKMGGPCVWRPTGPMKVDSLNKDSWSSSCYDGFDKTTMKRKVANTKRRDKRCCKNAEFDEAGIQRGSTCGIGKDTGATRGWSNMFALNYEVGLTHKFGLDEVAMRPNGCDGIELDDITSVWEGASMSNSQTLSPRADCPKQDFIGSEGTPIYSIVEEFADDHSVWAEAFLEAWPKMQELKQEGLKDGPANSWIGYHHLEEMGVTSMGSSADDFTAFIAENSPVVFTSENVDPDICSDGSSFCNYKVSDIYALKDIPIEAMGPPCATFEDCNNKEFKEE